MTIIRWKRFCFMWISYSFSLVVLEQCWVGQNTWQTRRIFGSWWSPEQESVQIAYFLNIFLITLQSCAGILEYWVIWHYVWFGACLWCILWKEWVSQGHIWILGRYDNVLWIQVVFGNEFNVKINERCARINKQNNNASNCWKSVNSRFLQWPMFVLAWCTWISC